MKGRTTIELMVLMLTATVCVAILLTGATIAVLEFKDPSIDTSSVVDILMTLVSGILGALLGLLAGEKGGHRLPTDPPEPQP